ncbi:DUF6941 family protein [Actinomyces sp. W5033]|uniref:DUF6941 family protein n=1 Tax=Actinomyces sp. W5033 TaxID=3446479 RepID=UPI003EDEF2EF
MLGLDCAFLADDVSIQGDRLTTVGASFTRMEAQALPARAWFAVAGRIRCDEAEREWVNLTIRFISPGEDPIVVDADLPLTDLCRQLHIHSDDEPYLAKLLPTLRHSLRFTLTST